MTCHWQRVFALGFLIACADDTSGLSLRCPAPDEPPTCPGESTINSYGTDGRYECAWKEDGRIYWIGCMTDPCPAEYINTDGKSVLCER